MALKAIVESLDSIPEAHRSFYIADGAGKFKLDAEGIEDVSGLKSALEKERIERRDAKAALEKYKDIDPVKYQAMLEQQRAIDEKKLIEAGKVDELVENRVQSMKEKYENDIKSLSTEGATLKGRLEKLLIDTEVQREAVSSIVPTAMDDVVMRARAVFKIVDGHAVPMRDEKIVYGEDGVTPITVKEWLAGLAKAAPHLFKQSQGGGAGNGGSRGAGSGSGSMDNLPAAERLKLSRRAAAGQTH